MEQKYVIALIVGLIIYFGAVSGVYLIYKPNLDYQRNRRKKLKEERQKALEMARKAKAFQKEHPAPESSEESAPENPDNK
ncbi:hypothetical protein KCG48_04130 [Proteiniclasticum sp. BAD-10]|uniref:Uncharacterized protein n=1 Tax=Proteiniclasticum sediminis TaxID=2804028 RepID=A0A941CMQ6_9CLOT|nr:hypothetical protein [Proteiniclasticum sediminis]MBR0575525.1 hypothetical protein [Proteiniclasticum sediminis]